MHDVSVFRRALLGNRPESSKATEGGQVAESAQVLRFPQRAPRNPNPRRGSRHYRAKLSEWDVQLILELLDEGVPHSQIAREFGVSKSSISHISSARNWKHV